MFISDGYLLISCAEKKERTKETIVFKLLIPLIQLQRALLPSVLIVPTRDVGEDINSLGSPLPKVTIASQPHMLSKSPAASREEKYHITALKKKDF